MRGTSKTKTQGDGTMNETVVSNCITSSNSYQLHQYEHQKPVIIRRLRDDRHATVPMSMNITQMQA